MHIKNLKRFHTLVIMNCLKRVFVSLWESPLEFRPERWESTTASHFKYTAFNAGRNFLVLVYNMCLVSLSSQVETALHKISGKEK